MHQISFGEVVYRIGKVRGWPVAERKRDEIKLLPITIVPFEQEAFWCAVQQAEHPLSYADAFAAALAIARGATFLTAAPEFGVLGDRLPRIAV